MTNRGMSIPQTMEYLHVSLPTLARWRALRIGPAFSKVGGRVTYSLEDLERFVKESYITCSIQNKGNI
jgi:hypothetical protein